MSRQGPSTRTVGSYTIPIVIVFLGFLFLMASLGIISWGNTWSLLTRLWPLVLVLLGIEIIVLHAKWSAVPLVILVVLVVGGFAVAAFFSLSRWWWGWGAPPISLEAPIEEKLGNLSKAGVELKAGGGKISLQSLEPSSANLVKGSLRYPWGLKPEVSLEQRDSKGRLAISARKPESFPWGGEPQGEWNLSFTPRLPLSLTLEAGAVEANLDLTALKVKELRVDVGAANLVLKTPQKAGLTEATIKAGASNLDIYVPEGVAARIEVRQGLSSLFIDESRFPKQDSYYRSPDYDQAENKLDLRLDAGVASINIR